MMTRVTYVRQNDDVAKQMRTLRMTYGLSSHLPRTSLVLSRLSLLVDHDGQALQTAFDHVKIDPIIQYSHLS